MLGKSVDSLLREVISWAILRFQTFLLDTKMPVDNIFNDLNLNLDSSWKLGLVGRNGRGKTTFLNLLRGKTTGEPVKIEK